MNLLLRGRRPDAWADDEPAGNDDPTVAFDAVLAPPPDLEAAAVFDETRPVDLGGPIRMHPRLAARWTQVRREAGRRRLRWVAAGATVLALVLAGVGSLYTPLFSVHDVVVTGAGPISRAEILAAAGVRGHPLLIGVNAGRAEARLDAIPQLGEASVSKQWPSTLRVRVVYRAPVALVAAASGPPWAVVDGTGRVLSQTATAPLGLPVILGGDPAPGVGQWVPGAPGPRAPVPAPGVTTGAQVNDPTAGPAGLPAALAVAAAIPPSLRGDVQSITFGPAAASFAGAAAGTLSMTVLPATMASGSIPVDLGDGSELGAKLTDLVTLLTEADLSGATGIDLSVPNRPAVLTAR